MRLNPIIREIHEDEYPVLEEFTYQAIYVPEGVTAPPRTILQDPNISMYFEEFGESEDDHGLVALVEHQIVGAIWARIMNDYGHVDKQTPSISMSILPAYRNRGIGSNLLKNMLRLLKDEGYRQVSLSVQKANVAVKMYEKAGFDVFIENAGDFVMLCRL